jgi:hypothetical protein
MDGFDLADFHVLKFDLGFSGLQPFGVLKGDRNRGAFFGNGLVCQPPPIKMATKGTTQTMEMPFLVWTTA